MDKKIKNKKMAIYQQKYLRLSVLKERVLKLQEKIDKVQQKFKIGDYEIEDNKIIDYSTQN